MPYSKSTQKDYGDNPLQKRSGFKMKGMDFGNSPLADKGEVVSKTSPGPGWTKTKGTNIWTPPKGELKKSMSMREYDPPKGELKKGMSISDFDDTVSR
jgi:hypothetical protein